jgi:NitT/TauT family transport system permease protein
MSEQQQYAENWLTRGAVTAEHAIYLKKIRLRRIYIVITQLVLLISFFLFWEFAVNTKIIDAFIISQPSKIFSYVISTLQNGTLYKHISYTVGETVVGFLVGTALGTIAAIVLWWSDFLSRVLDPYIVILNSMPKIALGPIFIIWLGNTIYAIIVMALAISVITTITVVYTGFKEVDPNKIKLVKTFGANKYQVLQKVLFPASIPTIIAALKVNVALTLVGVIVGEFLVSKAGLGYLIIYGGQVFNLTMVMSSIIILCIVAAVMYSIVSSLEKLVTKWQD